MTALRALHHNDRDRHAHIRAKAGIVGCDRHARIRAQAGIVG